jgi:rod shape-determining protein MreC
MRTLSPQAFLAIALIVLAIALFVLNVAGFLSPIQDALLRPLTSVQSWISLRFYALRDLLTSPRDVATLQDQVGELESEVANLQQQIIELREQAAEAEILGALLNYARSQPDSRYLAVNVIGRDPSPFIRSILVQGGSDDGISHGMPVVTEQGLVGRITEVRASRSRVQLLTDPSSSINVRMQESRADGVLLAQLNGDLVVDLIDQEAELQVGELVLTSGLGGGFPADIPIGQIVSIRKRDFELFQTAVIQPFVVPEDLEIVLIITNFRPIEIESPNPGN